MGQISEHPRTFCQCCSTITTEVDSAQGQGADPPNLRAEQAVAKVFPVFACGKLSMYKQHRSWQCKELHHVHVPALQHSTVTNMSCAHACDVQVVTTLPMLDTLHCSTPCTVVLVACSTQQLLCCCMQDDRCQASNIAIKLQQESTTAAAAAQPLWQT